MRWTETRRAPRWSSASSDANETKPVVTERRSDVPDESAAAGSAGSSSDEAATTEPSSHGGPFPVDIGDDGRQLVDEAGQPWVAIGDAGWSSLTALDEEEVEYYFEQLANLGYNAVLVNVIETEFTDHPPEDTLGNRPFVGDLFSSGPDPDYSAIFDAYVDQAARHGVSLLMWFAYLGYTDEEGVADELLEVSREDARAYGRFLGDRYSNARNIVWVLGGDRTEVSDDLLQHIDEIALGIQSSGGHQLMTAHAADGVIGSDVYGRFDWFQVETVYDIKGETLVDMHHTSAPYPPDQC